MFGLNFAPPTRPDRQEQQGAAAQLGPTQRAIQTLSLSLPRILGTRAISPASLLAPDTGAAGPVSPESAVLQSAIKAYQNPSGAPLPGGVPSDVIRQLVDILTSSPASGGGNAAAAELPRASMPTITSPAFGSTTIKPGDVRDVPVPVPGTPSEKNPTGDGLPPETAEGPITQRVGDLEQLAPPLTVDEIKRRFSPLYRRTGGI